MSTYASLHKRLTMKNFFTLTLCFLTLSLTAQEACPNPYDGNGDGNVSINDFLEMLSVFGDTDADSDGVWDSLDDCVDLAACNYATDPSEPCTYCLLYTSPSPRDRTRSRMPSSA